MEGCMDGWRPGWREDGWVEGGSNEGREKDGRKQEEEMKVAGYTRMEEWEATRMGGCVQGEVDRSPAVLPMWTLGDRLSSLSPTLLT